MDGLALLCNLFADGPVTLKRLRAARVSNLNELERTAPDRLADWLHASVPQARAFVEEARKLVRRLAETGAPAEPARRGARADRAPGRSLEPENDAVARHRFSASLPVASARASAPHRPLPGAGGSSSGGILLQPGLLPGLDGGACARLASYQVRTVQALSEAAGLALARRTGIPYSTLLELSRHARRALAAQEVGRPAPGRAEQPALVERELVPFARHPRGARIEGELARNDEFTLPVEPESAGPFG